jgi:hypothetical protein
MNMRHRAWLYKLKDGKVIAEIFEGTKKELEAKEKEGWVDTPALLKKHNPERDEKGHFIGKEKKQEKKGK